MSLTLNATYQEGALILSKKLGKEKEGKTFKVILLEEGDDLAISKTNFIPVC